MQSAHPESTTGFLCASAAEIQFRLALSGWFSRGAVAIGALHAAKEFVIGSGMLAAYKLEDEEAVVPRVIVDATIRRLLPSFLKYYSHPHTAPQNGYFAVDNDGQTFINYLYTPLGLDGDRRTLREFLATHRERVVEKLSAHSEPGHLKSKYLWTAAYHNWFCGQWLGKNTRRLTIPRVQPRSFTTLVDSL